MTVGGLRHGLTITLLSTVNAFAVNACKRPISTYFDLFRSKKRRKYVVVIFSEC